MATEKSIADESVLPRITESLEENYDLISITGTHLWSTEELLQRALGESDGEPVLVSAVFSEDGDGIYTLRIIDDEAVLQPNEETTTEGRELLKAHTKVNGDTVDGGAN